MYATAQQISELNVFFLHVSSALRPGKRFIGQLLAAAGTSHSGVAPSGLTDPDRRVTSGPLFHEMIWSFGDDL